MDCQGQEKRKGIASRGILQVSYSYIYKYIYTNVGSGDDNATNIYLTSFKHGNRLE